MVSLRDIFFNDTARCPPSGAWRADRPLRERHGRCSAAGLTAMIGATQDAAAQHRAPDSGVEPEYGRSAHPIPEKNRFSRAALHVCELSVITERDHPKSQKKS